MEERIRDILVSIIDEQTDSIDIMLQQLKENSLKFIQFIIELEEEFDIFISEENLLPERITSFEHLIELISMSESEKDM